MKIFLAGDTNGKLPRPIAYYDPPFTLQTFYEARNWSREKIIAEITQPDEFLLDSGAFTFFHLGRGGVDWDAYLETYIDFINKWDIKRFFELDIDAIVGTDEVQRMTDRLEEGTGRQAIPVFHQCRGLGWYRDACERYEFISISASGLTQETKWTRNKEALRALIKIAHDAGAKVHGLGYTRLDNINKTTVPFDSVDSTAWLSGQRYATIYKFTGEKLISQKVKGRSPGYKILNDHNIQEWIKMCRYKAKDDKW